MNTWDPRAMLRPASAPSCNRPRALANYEGADHHQVAPLKLVPRRSLVQEFSAFPQI